MGASKKSRIVRRGGSTRTHQVNQHRSVMSDRRTRRVRDRGARRRFHLEEGKLDRL